MGNRCSISGVRADVLGPLRAGAMFQAVADDYGFGPQPETRRRHCSSIGLLPTSTILSTGVWALCKSRNLLRGCRIRLTTMQEHYGSECQRPQVERNESFSAADGLPRMPISGATPSSDGRCSTRFILCAAGRHPGRASRGIGIYVPAAIARAARFPGPLATQLTRQDQSRV